MFGVPFCQVFYSDRACPVETALFRGDSGVTPFRRYVREKELQDRHSNVRELTMHGSFSRTYLLTHWLSKATRRMIYFWAI